MNNIKLGSLKQGEMGFTNKNPFKIFRTTFVQDQEILLHYS